MNNVRSNLCISQFLSNYEGNIEEAKYAIERSRKVGRQLGEYLNKYNIHEYVSLGHNCSTAHYLREVGLRKKAYPFDWVFSSNEIIADTLTDSFNAYIDKSQMVEHDSNFAVTHTRYHEYFFAHKNPLRNSEDFHYYERACFRFLELMRSGKNICFFITFISEPEKRPGWSKGFNQKFKKTFPSLKNTQALLSKFKKINPNIVFVVIDHWTEVSFDALFKVPHEDLVQIDFYAKGKSTGRNYVHLLDDFCFKLILDAVNNNSAIY
jgi:hypothetical protein